MKDVGKALDPRMADMTKAFLKKSSEKRLGLSNFLAVPSPRSYPLAIPFAHYP
jgi:hypothetical protein